MLHLCELLASMCRQKRQPSLAASCNSFDLEVKPNSQFNLAWTVREVAVHILDRAEGWVESQGWSAASWQAH